MFRYFQVSSFIIFFLILFISIPTFSRESDKWTPLPDTPDADFLYDDPKDKPPIEDKKTKTDDSKKHGVGDSIPKADNKKWDTRKEYRPGPIIDLLEKYSDNYSKKIMMIAKKNFEYALQTRKSDRQKLKKKLQEWKEKVYTNEKYHWQREDRKRKQRAYLKSLNRKSLQKFVNSQVKVIKYLHKIINRKVVKSEAYKNFKSDIYREYVKAQMSRHHYGQAIPFLEKYISISENNAKEQTVHQYLAFCYAKQEKAARKAKTSNKVIRFLNKKKNNHLLVYASLKYGRQSRQYSELYEKIERENIELLH